MSIVVGRIDRRVKANNLKVRNALRNHGIITIRLDSPDDSGFWLDITVFDDEIIDVNAPREEVRHDST